MKETLQTGARKSFSFTVPVEKTVPHLYPEAEEFQAMPAVFATGFMVGLMEWTCLLMLKPHLEANEGSLGIHVNVSHVAATLPGQTVTVEAECIAIEGRRVEFRVKAHDGVDVIGEDTHQRMVVDWNKFETRVNDKAHRAGVSSVSRRRE